MMKRLAKRDNKEDYFLGGRFQGEFHFGKRFGTL